MDESSFHAEGVTDVAELIPSDGLEGTRLNDYLLRFERPILERSDDSPVQKGRGVKVLQVQRSDV